MKDVLYAEFGISKPLFVNYLHFIAIFRKNRIYGKEMKERLLS